ncbi:hypothetical protein QQ045_009097 [Rhodiola kirilowii]
MNDAMRINQLWEMVKDEDSVWKAWTKAYWTKGRNWWEDGITNKNSWIIKEMEASRALSFKCISIQLNTLQWVGAGHGFLFKDTYDTIVQHSEKVEWYMLVWNRFNSLRCSIHLWLVAKNRLLTKGRLQDMGLNMDSLCVLCKGAVEAKDHLFFACHFAKEVRMNPTSWHLLILWFNKLNQMALRTIMVAAAVSMVAYEIWRARNSHIFRGEIPSINNAMRTTFW